MGKISSEWIGTGEVKSANLATDAVIESKIKNGAVTRNKIDATAKMAVLESKLVARKTYCLNLTASGSSVVVTSLILAAARDATPRTDLESGVGVYVGAVAGVKDPRGVTLRKAGTDNGIDDGTGDDAFGVLSFAAGEFTLSFKKQDGTPFSFSNSTAIDFQFAQIFTLASEPPEAGLYSVGGVVDATSASAIAQHKDDIGTKHKAARIALVRNDLGKKALGPSADDVETALAQVDEALGFIGPNATDSFTPQNYARTATKTESIQAASAHFKGIDSKLGEISTQVNTLAATVEGLTQLQAPLQKSERLTLSTEDIGLKYKDLAFVPLEPEAVIAFPAGGIPLEYGVDFQIVEDAEGKLRRFSWDGLSLGQYLSPEVTLRVIYLTYG